MLKYIILSNQNVKILYIIIYIFIKNVENIYILYLHFNEILKIIIFKFIY